jgi:TonB family protein
MTGLLTPLILTCLASTGLAQDPETTPEAEEAAALPIITAPAIVDYVQAPFPPEALELGIEGVVKLLLELDEVGDVVNIEIQEPAGHGFDEAAVDAVLQMRFSPALTEEGPVPVVFEFDYGFVLTPEEPEAEAAPAPINFEGLIREMGTRKPLEGVTIAVDDTDLTATTGADGRFELRGVPLGAQDVRLLHTGHVSDTRQLDFVEGEVTVVNLWLRSETYRENEVVASYQRKEEEVTRRTITIEEIRRVPGTFGDPIKVIQTLPGAARTPFGTGLLVIRGSNPEDSGVYIDGIRIPIIYHLTGTTSVLQPDIIESVDYLPGGYGVQYGRSMGGTVDVKTRTKFTEDGKGKLVWGTDILDTNLYYEGRVGKDKKHGIALGARRSYIDAFIPIFTKGTGFLIKPRYWDYQAKWVPDLDNNQSLSLFVYGFDDLLGLSSPDDVAQGADQDTQGDLRVQYNSHRFLLQYSKEFSDTVRLDMTPSVGVDAAYLGLGQEFSLDNGDFLTELRTELHVAPTPHAEIIPGIDFFGGSWGFDFRSAISIEDAEDPLAEREPVGFDGRGTLWSPDAFVKANLRPLNDIDRWLVTPGLRFNNVVLTQKGEVNGNQEVPPAFSWSLDPRILSRFQVTNDHLALKAATGLYHQPPQPQELVGVGTAAGVGHERSWATSVGFEHRINQSIHYDVDVFYKYLTDLIIYDENWTGFGSNPFFNGGDGRAYGLEVIARHDPTGRFFGWVSYTLSKAVRRDLPYCSENRETLSPYDRMFGLGTCFYPFDFDQTHIFSAQGGYDLPMDFGISAQVQYVTGNPTSTFDAGIYDADADFYNGFSTSTYNQERVPPFFQTSLRFDKLFTFKRWQMETYVDLINAVRGVNPEFTIYNYDYSEAAYVRGLPFIPNIGLEAKFYL